MVGLEKLGVGQLVGPEDLAYDTRSGLIYTGCADGWIKRVKVNKSNSHVTVENWVKTGGRPLGLAFGRNKEGLLNVSRHGKVRLLTDQAEGVKFRLTDSVDVAKDGMVYFADASYKYSLSEFTLDFLEGKPHGRLLSYNPRTKRTRVLVRDLYFANGVAVSPDQNSIVFCETAMVRCRKYHRRGTKNGTVTSFVDNLPGLPDNIRYAGKGNYWIALAAAPTRDLDLALMRHSLMNLTLKEKYVGMRVDLINKGGVLKVDTKGNRKAHYFNPELSLISSGKKIGNHLYCGSLFYSYIIRINLRNHSQPT
ncbi:hypothetical protein FEM48_Zijuj08G0079800 [Ziziphus jujuba var. spinosa]|uniref:Strictosidine synthase conserved region domain-containing protein n=1 Tax=Ziziphus jujuba var. spinosa TaxID=714518 RepID=A0A978UXX4_ZIZJJ|nr:hypothetical protein FEM48_Zijuj08G0079800 [Ziziphus jujuba var. spinosa]